MFPKIIFQRLTPRWTNLGFSSIDTSQEYDVGNNKCNAEVYNHNQVMGLYVPVM